ncbi:sulfite exporter TauE/SafE family protein [Pseudomonas capsici]|uniref:sulfite exporter TauE/SafE family protein n=1 Tax=Pseudomonas capsici TaxID=2810614 RepID=UPI0021F0F705|nr:sulfite exporter TauE/SafE family protein [Pseudomonas capsici]MCV4274229.1 sulfite exporter TauE/SafE family protein [Pseudomonas capsici]
MSFESIALLITGAAAGGFINGLAGFGTALFSLGIWLQIMPTWQAVAIVAAMSVASGLQSLWLIRKDLNSGLSKLPRFLLPALAGLPAGAAILEMINGQVLKMVIAGFMLLYGAFFTLRRSLPQFSRPMPVVDSLIGLSGGFLGGIASLSGPLPTMWCAMQPWTKTETSAVLRPYNVVILAIAVMIFARNGYYSSDTLVMMAIALPATLIASKLGVAVFYRLNDGQFRRVIIWLMFISGMLLATHQLAQR